MGRAPPHLGGNLPPNPQAQLLLKKYQIHPNRRTFCRFCEQSSSKVTRYRKSRKTEKWSQSEDQVVTRMKYREGFWIRSWARKQASVENGKSKQSLCSGPQSFGHHGQVSYKTIFPWTGRWFGDEKTQEEGHVNIGLE